MSFSLLQEQAAELVANENILLQTLGFDVAIDHPHTHVVRCCQLVKASKELAQTSYFMATNSLHLTTMCLRYPPTVVACVCIHLACKWSNYKIPTSSEGKPWFHYIDSSANQELLEKLTDEFLIIFDKCPSRLKRKIMASTEAVSRDLCPLFKHGMAKFLQVQNGSMANGSNIGAEVIGTVAILRCAFARFSNVKPFWGPVLRQHCFIVPFLSFRQSRRRSAALAATSPRASTSQT